MMFSLMFSRLHSSYYKQQAKSAGVLSLQGPFTVEMKVSRSSSQQPPTIPSAPTRTAALLTAAIQLHRPTPQPSIGRLLPGVLALWLAMVAFRQEMLCATVQLMAGKSASLTGVLAVQPKRSAPVCTQ